MREIVLDTETTGLDPADGHRIVEIGAVELMNHMPTGKTWHHYLNPGRPMPKEAEAIHGISDAMLRGKPNFSSVALDFLKFIGTNQLVIHNASFDMKFLNAELQSAGHKPLPMSRALDTVALARQKFPGSPASLDALCRRFGVDTSARDKHGALLDSTLLAEVYLELIGGRQPDFGLTADQSASPAHSTNAATVRAAPRPHRLPPRLTPDEQTAHENFVSRLPNAIWSQV